ncbi:ABC transporter ATP-binding protein [Cellulomonas sp. URHB0016]
MNHQSDSAPGAAPGTAPGARSPGAAMLDFTGVGMTYPGGAEAVRGVDLTVRRGEFVSVVGPSGCGKSTLLGIASGLASPTAGSAVVDAQRAGFVFQDANLLPWRSVLKNVELFLELDGQLGRARRANALDALETVGLTDYRDYLPHQLSGGMRMRVSLARSLTLEPDLFLFDEPFGALDELTRERLNDEVLALFADRLFAGLFVTHSVREAIYMSTRVVVMSGSPGRIVDVVDVPFGLDRGPGIRFRPEFTALTERINAALRTGYAG